MVTAGVQPYRARMDLATPYDRLRDFVDRMATIGDQPHDDADLRVRKHALAITVLGLIPAAVLWAIIGVIIDRPLLIAASLYFALAMPLTLVGLSSTKAFEPVVRFLLLVGLSYVILGHLALGGMSAGGASLIWGLVAPVSAVLYFDRSSSMRWFIGFGAIVVGAIILDPWIVEQLPASWSSPPSWLFAYNLLGPALFVLLLIRFVDGQRLTAQEESRQLLQDMLPGRIAERLADGERMIAETHPDVSVLFADVVGFTEFAEHVEADDLLLTLNQLFSAFDRIAARHGIEKIKTTGDAYIAVAGAPVTMEGHALAAVRAAADMHRAVERLGGLRRRGMQLRVGIASGSITAGVIGEHRYTYDMWGDTVNVASRMESTGVPGMIQVAASTHDLVGDGYPWTERQVLVKGKGEMTAYLMDPDAIQPLARRAAAGDGLYPLSERTAPISADAAASPA
jgi:class 3 adenylate cyclase